MSILGSISTKEHYGVRLILRIAETFYTNKPISISEISEKEHLSSKYLEHLVVPFRNANWIKSQRGRDGGYLMLKDPHEVSLKDIIVLLNEDVGFVECLKEGKRNMCSLEKKCKCKSVFGKLQKIIEAEMENIKCDSLLNN